MSLSVVFVERRDPETSSFERVFETVGKALSELGVEVHHSKLPFDNSFWGMILNIFARRPSYGDLYHITGQIHYYALLLPSEKTLLTIHDLHILKDRKGIRRYLIKKLFYDLPAKRLRYITTISEHTRAELIKLTGCRGDKIRVIENPLTIDSEPHLRPFDKDKPTVLHIGTALHKNLPNLIRAVSTLDCKLVIVGILDEFSSGLLLQNNILFENKIGLSAASILAEYRNADIVSFCSLAEGFGLPIIEAQALGVPLITSDLSPMREVAGAGAVLADPHSPADIRDGILRIMNNEQLRSKIVEKGRENVKRFDPERIADQYRELYVSILKKNDQSGKLN